MYVHRCLLVHITTTCDAVVLSGKMKCRVPRNSRCSLNVECAHIARSLAPLLHEQVARTQTPTQTFRPCLRHFSYRTPHRVKRFIPSSLTLFTFVHTHILFQISCVNPTQVVHQVFCAPEITYSQGLERPSSWKFERTKRWRRM